ncbi:Uncharacterised protein [Mycobacteroides abscessus subsp. abscessus]|uniref:Uncharacterized protein n=1 Tax=Mycobacteroides abscessus TaxID=36809 RepID=A0AB33SWZ1_9MYCO|nr:Uncharacterised protein [Mycobacteroides abscessus]SHS86739.1 Uncharacterised protein [Mycobacteroides abscessus subsp. abscessus]CPT03466.1 Uncharacterised protein [Mycobacteroides abscessus]CPT67627.1 Uncharacterised protein [Mycobacteroides abscessus]CPT68821.1 Uncharacterised protein [Mycobacteroides abscessus]
MTASSGTTRSGTVTEDYRNWDEDLTHVGARTATVPS